MYVISIKFVPLASVVATLFIGISACKDRKASKSKALPEALTGPCTAEGVAMTVVPLQEFRDSLKDPNEANFYQRKFHRIDDVKVWTAHSVIQEKKLSNGGIAIPVTEYKVSVKIKEKDLDLSILLSTDDVLVSPTLAKNLLAQAESDFLKDLPIKGIKTESGLVLGFNMLKSLSDTTKDPKEALSGSSGVDQEEASFLGDVLKLPQLQIQLPLYMLSGVDLSQNRTFRSRSLQPGDVFTVEYRGGVYGAGFGVWLGDKPVLVPQSVRNDVFAFARLSKDSLPKARNLALGTTAVVESMKIEASNVVNLSAQSDRKPNGDIEVIGYKISRSMINGGILISNGNESNIPNFFTGSTCQNAVLDREKLSDSDQSQLLLEEISKSISESQQRIESFSSLIGSVRTAFQEMRRKDFEFVNRLNNELLGKDSTSSFSQPHFFSKAVVFYSTNAIQKGSSKFSDSQIEQARNVIKIGQKLILKTNDLKVQISQLMNLFNFCGERTTFDDNQNRDKLQSLKNASDSVRNGTFGGSVLAMDYLTTNTRMMEAAANIYLRKNLNPTEDRELKRWFSEKSYRSVLAELTGELESNLSGVNPAKFLRNHAEKIYFGLDNLRLEYGREVFPILDTTNNDLRIGQSRYHRTSAIVEAAAGVVRTAKERFSLLIEFQDAASTFHQTAMTK